jgi:hypothetical protein
VTRLTALVRPTPNQISRNGAAIRIGTVPAVIITGFIAARTNQIRAERRPSATPIAVPRSAAMTTFSVV